MTNISLVHDNLSTICPVEIEESLSERYVEHVHPFFSALGDIWESTKDTVKSTASYLRNTLLVPSDRGGDATGRSPQPSPFQKMRQGKEGAGDDLLRKSGGIDDNVDYSRPWDPHEELEKEEARKHGYYEDKGQSGYPRAAERRDTFETVKPFQERSTSTSQVDRNIDKDLPQQGYPPSALRPGVDSESASRDSTESSSPSSFSSSSLPSSGTSTDKRTPGKNYEDDRGTVFPRDNRPQSTTKTTGKEEGYPPSALRPGVDSTPTKATRSSGKEQGYPPSALRPGVDSTTTSANGNGNTNGNTRSSGRESGSYNNTDNRRGSGSSRDSGSQETSGGPQTPASFSKGIASGPIIPPSPSALEDNDDEARSSLPLQRRSTFLMEDKDVDHVPVDRVPDMGGGERAPMDQPSQRDTRLPDTPSGWEQRPQVEARIIPDTLAPRRKIAKDEDERRRNGPEYHQETPNQPALHHTPTEPPHDSQQYRSRHEAYHTKRAWVDAMNNAKSVYDHMREQSGMGYAEVDTMNTAAVETLGNKGRTFEPRALQKAVHPTSPPMTDRNLRGVAESLTEEESNRSQQEIDQALDNDAYARADDEGMTLKTVGKVESVPNYNKFDRQADSRIDKHDNISRHEKLGFQVKERGNAQGGVEDTSAIPRETPPSRSYTAVLMGKK